MTATPEEPLEPDEVAPGGDPGLDPADPDAVPEPAPDRETADPAEVEEQPPGNERPMNLPS